MLTALGFVWSIMNGTIGYLFKDNPVFPMWTLYAGVLANLAVFAAMWLASRWQSADYLDQRSS